MLRVRLREMMEKYRRRTGKRITYAQLAQKTGLSRATLASIATRGAYNTRLSTIGHLCQALECDPGEMLEFVRSPPARRPKGARP